MSGVGASKASGRQCRASGAGSAGVLRPAMPGQLGRQCRPDGGGSAGPGLPSPLAAFLLLLHFLGALAAFLLLLQFLGELGT